MPFLFKISQLIEFLYIFYFMYFFCEKRKMIKKNKQKRQFVNHDFINYTNSPFIYKLICPGNHIF